MSGICIDAFYAFHSVMAGYNESDTNEDICYPGGYGWKQMKESVSCWCKKDDMLVHPTLSRLKLKWNVDVLDNVNEAKDPSKGKGGNANKYARTYR